MFVVYGPDMYESCVGGQTTFSHMRLEALGAKVGKEIDLGKCVQ